MQIPPFQSGQPEPGYERIMAALEAVLATDKFMAAPQMSAFLRYVVEQAATGNKARIKAFTVAVDALGKPDTFDPQNDPVVRVLAGRLRSTLATYYKEHPQADVVFEMKPGSYVPAFIVPGDRLQIAEQAGHDPDAPGTVPSEAVDRVDDAQVLEAQTALKAEAGFPQAANQTLGKSSGWKRFLSINPADSDKPRNYKAYGRKAQDLDNGRYGRQHTGSWFHLSLPAWSFIAIAATAGILGPTLYLSRLHSQSQPALLAGSPVAGNATGQDLTTVPHGTIRIFVSALEPSDSIESHLNSMMSGVFSEAPNVRVFRIMPTARVGPYGAEDYLMSLDVLPLDQETRVSVQLIHATTGQVRHADTLYLGPDAARRLSSEEMLQIAGFARQLMGENGPVFKDYQATLKE